MFNTNDVVRVINGDVLHRKGIVEGIYFKIVSGIVCKRYIVNFTPKDPKRAKIDDQIESYTEEQLYSGEQLCSR